MYLLAGMSPSSDSHDSSILGLWNKVDVPTTDVQLFMCVNVCQCMLVLASEISASVVAHIEFRLLISK